MIRMAILRSIIWRFGVAAALGCVVLGAILGMASIWRSTDAARETAGHVLTVVIEERAQDLNGYLYLTERASISMARAEHTAQAIHDLQTGWAEFGPDARTSLHALYIDDNPYEVSEKQALDDAGDGSFYSAVHARIHDRMRVFRTEGSYYDAFLLDLQGNILYTVIKERDFATNLLTGELADTGLSAAYRVALDLPAGQIAFNDLNRYGPSGDVPAGFMATPVFSESGERVGVLAIQVDVEHINRLINRPTAFGETIQAYAVGQDGLLRSRPPEAAAELVLSQAISPDLAAALDATDKGVIEMTDFAGHSVIAAFTHFEFQGARWSVVASQESEEAFASARGLAHDLGVLTLLVTAFVAFGAALYAVRESRPLKEIADAALALASGKLHQAVPHRDRSGEVGGLANAVERLKEDAVLKLQLEKQAAEAQARAAAAADEAKSAFVASLSHEIRTPLNGILGITQVLSSSKLDKRQSHQVSLLLDSGQMLRTLVDDVLDMSKIEAGMLDLNPTAMDTRAELRSVLSLYQAKADEKGLKLELDIDERVPQLLSLDPVRVRQCVGNLVSNAVKFTEDGAIWVQVSSAPVDDDQHRLIIEVIDTGIGMDDKTRESLFADYVQAQQGDTGGFGGTGLGLAITRKLAHLMGGDVKVTSAPGAGSTFALSIVGQTCVTCPQSSDCDARAVSDHLDASLSGYRILVVDDVPINRSVASYMLTPLGATVTEAEDGLAALEALEREEFDIVLLDRHMPRMDGLQTISTIRARSEPWNAIPVIALTADAMKDARSALMDAGADDFVSKPFDRDQLIQKILAATRGPQARRASG